jgi:hypothetical protein
MSAAEVKGVWFVTARRQITEAHGEAVLARVIEALDEPDREIMRVPLASAWYPEDVFQRVMRACMNEVARGDAKAFCAFIEACTLLGVNTFFRVLLRIPSPAFLMRKMPVLSKQYRRNDSLCTVESDARQATLVWTNFPYFEDLNYRLCTLAMLTKTAELCARKRPRGEIVAWGSDSLTVSIQYG